MQTGCDTSPSQVYRRHPFVQLVGAHFFNDQGWGGGYVGIIGAEPLSLSSAGNSFLFFTFDMHDGAPDLPSFWLYIKDILRTDLKRRF